MPKLKPKDLIAAIILVGVIILKYNGFDGKLDAILTLIVGYYFAHRVDGIDKGI